MVDQVLALPEGSKLMLLAPVMRERKGEHLALLDELRAQGLVRARIDGRIRSEIYDYLRLLFARAGEPRCPDHDLPLAAQTVSQMVDQVLALPEGSKLMLLAPVMRERKGEHLALLDELRAQGFVRARIDGRI